MEEVEFQLYGIKFKGSSKHKCFCTCDLTDTQVIYLKSDEWWRCAVPS